MWIWLNMFFIQKLLSNEIQNFQTPQELIIYDVFIF